MPFPTYGTPAHTHVSVDYAASTLVLAANPGKASYRSFRNPQKNNSPIWLACGAAAAVGGGLIDLAPGDTYEMSSQIGNLYQGAVYAIVEGAAPQNLLVTEGV